MIDKQVSSTFQAEQIPITELHSHPRNYQDHPEDELEHIIASIKEHGFYRNIVIACDNTILAGHGVVEASRKMGLATVPAIRVDYAPDDPRALKLLVGDNEIRHLAEVDDRALTELLREINEVDVDGLLGTGYDEMMLSNLVMVSRPAEEIEDMDAAAQWVGLPEYEMEGEHKIQIIVNFMNEEDRKEFCQLLGLEASKIATTGTGKSIWWPKRPENDDVKSVRFSSAQEDEDD